MTAGGCGPRLVDVDEAATRRSAANVVARAYLLSPAWWLCVVLGTLMTLIFKAVSWLEWSDVLVVVVTGGLAFPAAMWCSIRWARTLYWLRTDAAATALVVRADQRRGARQGDVQAHSFGAHPRGRGAGALLGEWVARDVMAQGCRLTATALPRRAETYIRWGMVEDGRSAGFLIRLATPDGSVRGSARD